MTSRPLSVFFIAFAGFLIACEDNEVDPAVDRETLLIPVRMEEEGFRRELTFDELGRLKELKSTTRMVDGTSIESLQVLHYDGSGRFEKITLDDNWRIEYTYENDVIVRSDEFYEDELYIFHRFVYDENGRLTETHTFMRGPEGEDAPVNKGVYMYDVNGNLSLTRAYAYENGAYQLNTTFQYADFDDKKSADQVFSVFSFNPVVKYHTHNPGRMTVRNGNGLISSTEEYTYRYNEQGYPVARTTVVNFPHTGHTGTYDTYYFYQAGN